MALQLKDRVRTACTTVGTGNIIVGSNRAGFQNWDAIDNTATVYYCIVEGNDWEVGHGTKINGSPVEITRNVIASSSGSLIDLKGTEDVFETYPAEKAVILDVDGNLTVDGDVFADNLYTKTSTDTLLDSKANVGDSYLKSETYSSVEVDGKLFEKADKTDTYTKAEVDATQDAQDTNINSNTTAIGTLSGKVATNTADIATLQEGIFFSSSYTTDYPSNPNRDPETGNIYLQDLSAFTYSYADANQAFISKTDEQGNVRQFTAVKPDDIIVLNQVESPNYGRYKVSAVNDLGDYVNVIMDFQVGEGTVLEGDTLALQAFPASEGGGSSLWTEADGVVEYDGGVAGEQFYIEQFSGDRANYIKKYADPDNTIEFSSAFGGFKFLTDGTNNEALILARDGKVTIPTGNVDITKVVTAEKFVSTTGATTADAPNVHMTAGGSIIKSTTATYSAEEVDARLAIKDKLIEKLSARLDKLEKKVK